MRFPRGPSRSQEGATWTGPDSTPGVQAEP